MSIKILICDPFDVEGVEMLRREGFKVHTNPSISHEELETIVSDYEVLIVRGRTKITRAIVDLGSKLKVIGRAGSGLDNIDLNATNKKEITVFNTPEALADSVAELTIGLMLSVVRNLPFADLSVKEAKWLKKELNGILLRGKTLGLVGLGNIGLKVAKIAKQLGMRILVTKRTLPKHEILNSISAVYVPIETLLEVSDIISIHVPLTEETARMIGLREIKSMKKGAFIINTSRGGVLDEKALLEGLKSGRLGGVALDVYEFEPPRNFELLKMPNVVCTPHIGAQTKEAQKTASILLANKIISFFRKKS